MRIVRMYSGVLAGSQDWKKVEVEVDENDLSSILYENGLEYVSRSALKTKYAFQLLTLEAEILLKTTMVQSFEVNLVQAKADLEILKSRKFSVIEQLLEEFPNES